MVCHSPTILVNFAASYNTLAYYVSTGITQKINHNHDHRNQFLIKTTIISFFISGCLHVRTYIHVAHARTCITQFHSNVPTTTTCTTLLLLCQKLQNYFLYKLCFAPIHFASIYFNMIHNRPRAARHDLL